MFSRLRRVLDSAVRRRDFEAGLDVELQFHIEEYMDDLVRSGVSRTEALRRARVEFGSVNATKEECREARGLRWIDEFSQDLKYAGRALRHSPGFAAAAILSLALGIGVNTAIFSLMDEVLLRSLPVGDPHELYFIGHGSSGSDRVHMSANYPLFEMYRARADVFSGIAAALPSEYKVDAGTGVEIVSGQLATGNFHSVLQVPFVLGHGFQAENDRRIDAVAVISHRFWTNHFAKEKAVLGRTVYVSGKAVTIIGVTAPEFYGVYPGRPADITISMSLAPQLRRPDFFSATDTWTNLTLVGRLKSGAGASEAQSAVDRVYQQFVNEPPANWVRKMSPEAFEAARLEPAAKGMDDLRRRFSQPLQVLFGIVLLVLAVACANTSSLLLARAGAREKEIAVRLSLGVSRIRLLKQLMTESVVLASLGGSAGAVLAFWSTEAMVRLIAVGRNPIELEAAPNLRVLAFTAFTSLTCGIVFGLAPAIRALRVNCSSALKGTARAAGSFRAGRIIVAAQIAVCVLLLTAAGLFTRTLSKIQGADIGFERENMLLANLNAHGSGLDSRQTARAFDEVLRRVGALPGVSSAAISDTPPLSTSGNQRPIRVPGRQTQKFEDSIAWNVLVSPAFFETYRIALRRGRVPAPQDGPGRPLVAVLNQAAADKFFPAMDPTGRHFFFGTNETPVQVIGVVGNAAQIDPRHTTSEIVYTPIAQFDEPVGTAVLAIRSAVDPTALIAQMRSEVRSVSPSIAIQYVRTMPDQMNALLLNETILAALSSLFAILAAVLACVGLYGVMAYTVARRTREMGLRIALGATVASVRWMVIRQALTVVTAGLAAGVPASLVASRRLEGLLFGVQANDPIIYTGVIVVLATAALIAAFLPARAASKLNPVQALRIE